MEEFVSNAKIEHTFLGMEDHGIFTFMIDVEHEHGHQGFGNVTRVSATMLRKILETVGVERWESLPGHTCRVRGTYQSLTHIGHYLEDKWYSPADDWKPGKGEIDG